QPEDGLRCFHVTGVQTCALPISYGCTDGIEEDDLDAELACLEDDWAAEEISQSASAISQDVPEAAPYWNSMPSQTTAEPHVFNEVGRASRREAEEIGNTRVDII